MFDGRGFRLVMWIALSCIALDGCMSRPGGAFYSTYESMLVQDGLLRTETAPADAPYSVRDLVRNFERIALRKEANAAIAGGDSNSTPTSLRRWVGPLRYRIDGSAATAADRTEISWLMQRIATLTDLDVRESSADANFLILLTTPEERDRVGAELANKHRRFAVAFDYWRHDGRLVCIADREVDSSNSNRIIRAIAVIGSETTGVLRKSCLHEEIVQALGLSNDHSDVRPSIFNDDAEFALLTKHDEALLRILYDQRLTPGMTAQEAMPIINQIVRDNRL